jgi:bacterial leucyl aminopeptidase
MKFKPLLAAAAAALAVGSAAAAPAWLTMGADAFTVLRKMVPHAEVLGTATLRTEVPVDRRSGEVREHAETVVAVEVDDRWLEILSVMLHREVNRCSGYVYHQSMAEALATLHRLEQGVEPMAVGPVPSYALDNQREVALLMPRVQGSHLMATVDTLAAFQNRRHNSSTGLQAANWLAAHWDSLIPTKRRSNVRVTVIQHPSSVTPQPSVMLEIIGRTRPNESVILGGHLDSIAGSLTNARAPGADDNASGIAGLTEIIRVMMEGGYQPDRTLRFIGYAAEEVGLRGSNAIAASYLTSTEQVVGVLQLDMTAFQGDSTDIWLYTDYTNAQQNQFLANIVTKYLPEYTVGYSACGYACSDHASWHNRGFRVSFPHEASNANYNRAIHTINDTTATFGNTPQHMLKFTRLALVYAVELGSLARVR